MAQPSVVVDLSSSDDHLIERCLEGDEQAWSALVDKYRNLIFSIPIRYGLSQEDATEVFQEVCLSLLSALPRLRNPQTLPAWLIRVTKNHSSHWRCKQHRHDGNGPAPDLSRAAELSNQPDEMLQELHREQTLRTAISDLEARCRRLIRMLFFTTPTVPYAEVAKDLGIATGSVGFIRMRCLARLRKRLEEKHFL